ncbi:HNH endonuclease [Methylobacterium bullatum]|uniref:HNH endonuclease signature motif containing protein n=1 Tax=Methylobacterium bullatum TaxID=570505 RepID=UPI00177E00BA|nr:HNH endonuclease [Methylobacterium bullatum]
MNYSRIYSEFIANRRARSTPYGYSERHHIVPRALGGGDDNENLIDLTAEDHFFAHLLLAKIHGGKLWAPIAFMVGGSRKDYRPIVSRARYGWASRAMARAASGKNARQYDWTEHRLEHDDGRVWVGTQADMHVVLGMTRALANLLIKGRIGSANGWFPAGKRPPYVGRGSRNGAAHPMHRAELINFLHVDGRSFSGTQFQLHREHGVTKSAACNLARGKVKVANGWYVEGTALPTTGRGARWLKIASASV